MAGTEDENKGLFNAIQQSTKQILGAFAANIRVSDLTSVIDQVDKAASEVINIFGQGQEMVVGLKQSMTQAIESVDRLGGDFNSILNIQKEIATNFNRNLVVSRDSYEGFFAAMKVTGVDTGTMVNNFKDAGISAYDSVTQMQKVVDIARESGINVGKVSDMVTKNISELNKYNFQGGVEGLAKMAAQAASLRIDMSATMSFAKDVFKPEGAIEMAAALQRLGVAQSDLLDPLRLMDLSANDPTELQNQIVQMTSQFVKMNEAGKFEIMPGAKRQFMEIADAMHIPYEQLTKMALGSADLNEKMKQIKFPESAVSDDQRKMIANLAELKDGKAMVTFNDETGKQVTKEVSDLNPAEVAILEQGNVQKSMEQLAKEQLSTSEDMKASLRSIADRGRYAVAGARTTQAGLDFERKLYQGIEKSVPKSMSTASMQNQFDTTASGTITSIAKLVKGDFAGSLSTASKTVGNVGDALKTLAKEGISQTSTEFIKLKTQLSGTVDMFKKMSDARLNKPYTDTNVMPPKKVNDFVINGQNLVTNPADTIFGGTGANKFFESINKITSSNGSVEGGIMKHEGDVNVNLSIKVDAPQNINTEHIVLAMKDHQVSQSITKAVQDALSGNGQFGNPNQTKRNNDVRNKLVTT
jgi:hypothetical protein